MKQNETNHGVEMGGRVLPTSTKNINKKTQQLEATVKAGINGIMVTPWKHSEKNLRGGSHSQMAPHPHVPHSPQEGRLCLPKHERPVGKGSRDLTKIYVGKGTAPVRARYAQIDRFRCRG